MLGETASEQNFLHGISHKGAAPELLRVQPPQAKLKTQTKI